MQKTFSLQNMETYFKNYVCCNEHKNQPITNFCTESPCLKFLCPECIERHSSVHSNHSIQSIKTCIKKTSQKLKATIFDLQTQINRNSFLKSDDKQEYTKKLIRELQEVKEGLIAQIKVYFKEKEYDIRKQTSKYVLIQKKLEILKKDIYQVTSQMKMLDKNLLNTQETVKAITKANKLNFPVISKHFHQRIDELERQMNFSVHLQMNNSKRQMLRKSLNQLIGVRGSDQFKRKENRGYPLREDKVLKESRKKMERSNQNKTNGFQVNPPPLSADRLLQQNSFLIEQKNYFQHDPFMHFFQISNSVLHLVRIGNITESQAIKWQIIPLNISFSIPSFHRTVATQNGNIYIIGGTDSITKNKISTIYQYDPINTTLNKVNNLMIARSSHSIVCHKGLIYISGGMTNNDQPVRKCQVYNPSTNEIKVIAPCKYATTNSCFCFIGDDQLLKFGGVFANGESNNTIEVYNIKANLWGEVDPTIQNMNGEFGLLSCSGWAPLNETQIFIFGGYNEEENTQNSRMSFVLEQNKQDNQFYIKYINQKNPPFAEGFWNQQGVVHNGRIFSLQNVDGDEEPDCMEDIRNLLIFNGKTWSTCYQKN